METNPWYKAADEFADIINAAEMYTTGCVLVSGTGVPAFYAVHQETGTIYRLKVEVVACPPGSQYVRFGQQPRRANEQEVNAG